MSENKDRTLQTRNILQDNDLEAVNENNSQTNETFIQKAKTYFIKLNDENTRTARLVKFAIVSTIGLGLNQLMVFLSLITLNTITTIDPLFTFSIFGISIKIAKIIVSEFIAILFVTVFNYVVNKFWTFRKIEQQAEFNTVIQFIKFAIVGASGTLVNLGLTYLFAVILNWNDYLSTAIGFIASVLSNFILNDIWTFNPRFAKSKKALQVSKNQNQQSVSNDI